MRVSTRGDYAARALLSLALHSETSPTSVREIAERTVLPQPYLEQILLALKGAGLVRSKRGVGGGYVLARDPEDIKLSEIIRAVDGPITAGDFGEPTPTAPVTTKASASFLRSGVRRDHTCEPSSTAFRSPTSRACRRAGSPGLPLRLIRRVDRARTRDRPVAPPRTTTTHDSPGAGRTTAPRAGTGDPDPGPVGRRRSRDRRRPDG